MTMLQSYRKKVTKVQCIKPASSELNSLYFYIFLKFSFEVVAAVMKKKIWLFSK